MLFRRLIGAGIVASATMLCCATNAAADPPNCSAGDLAGVMSGVNAGMATYLFTHPEVNDFFTGLHGLPHNEIEAKVNEYFEANPQIGAELKGIRKPLQDVRIRCGDTDGDGDVDIL